MQSRPEEAGAAHSGDGHPLDGRSPVLPMIIDLSEPLPTLVAEHDRYRFAHCLVVVRGAPVGWIDVRLTPGGVPPELLAETLWSRLRRSIVAQLARRGMSAPGSLPVEGFDLGPAPLRQIDPDMAVVIATRERPEHLRNCLMSVLDGATVPDHLVVVDNAPTTSRTEELVRRLTAEHPSLTYVREERPGLGRAHNASLPHLRTRLVAFTDDDVLVNRWWLARIREAFDAAPDVACVTGMIAPLELDTRTQQLIEAHAGFSKGFEQRIFDPNADRRDDLLFPFAAGVFGSGANMAFDVGYLRSVGGFDAALGAGTVALGGDDLAAFYDVMASGHRLVYEPAAVVSHRHHRELDALQRQAYGYGAGLSAHLTRCILNDPRVALSMLRGVPPALRRAARIARPQVSADRPAPPSSLTLHHLRGMAAGPVRYVRSRRADRAGRPDPTPPVPASA
jgi:O-antigen biosynthesis protein